MKRIYLVNRDLQLKYARLGVLVGALSTILTLVLVLYPLFHLQLLRFPNFLPPPFLVGIGLAALANFLAVAFLAILFSHRIAGPMFSLVRQMRQVEAGQWVAQVKVRASDDLKYLVRHFNAMMDALLVANAHDQRRLDEVARLLRSEPADRAAALRLVDELRRELSQRALEPTPAAAHVALAADKERPS